MASFFDKLKRGMGIEDSLNEEKEQEQEETPMIIASSLEDQTVSPKKTKSKNKPASTKPKKLEIKTIALEPSQSKKTSYSKKTELEFTELAEEKENAPEEPADMPVADSKTEITIEEMPIEKETGKKSIEYPIAEVQEISTQTVPSKESFKEKLFEDEGQLAVDIYQTEDDLVIQSAIAGVRSEDLDIIIENDVVTIRGQRKKPCEEGEGCDYFTKECFWGPFSREVILPAEVDSNFAKASMKAGVLVIRLPKILKEKKRKILVKETS